MSAAKKTSGRHPADRSGSVQRQSWQNARDDMLDTIPWWQIPYGDDRRAFRDMLDNSSTTSVATKDSGRTSISGSIYEDGSANLRKRLTKTFGADFKPSLPPARSKRMDGYSFDQNYEISQVMPDRPLQFKSLARMHWDRYLTVKPLVKSPEGLFQEAPASDEPPKLRVRVHISQKKARGQKHRKVYAEGYSSPLEVVAPKTR